MTQTSEYSKRIKLVQRWLKASGWKPDADFDYSPITARAKRRWYAANPARAETLVAKAARLLRGEAVQISGGRPRTTARMEKRAMMKISVDWIEPDADTFYLVGPEGLVWAQPAIGEAHIVAARNEQERKTAEAYIGELLRMGLVPYGLPLNQRVTVAIFGGSPIRDCRWMKYAEAPSPAGESGDELPTRAAVIH